MDKRLQNLRPWKPGQSGNPGGRPRRKPVTDRLRDILESTDKNGKTVADRIVEAIRDAAIGGDVRFVELILDRIEGKVPNILQVDDFSNDNDSDIDAIYSKAGLSFSPESDGGPGGPSSEPCSSADPAPASPSPGESCGP